MNPIAQKRQMQGRFMMLLARKAHCESGFNKRHKMRYIGKLLGYQASAQLHGPGRIVGK
jgi:hypothetical protein